MFFFGRYRIFSFWLLHDTYFWSHYRIHTCFWPLQDTYSCLAVTVEGPQVVFLEKLGKILVPISPLDYLEKPRKLGFEMAKPTTSRLRSNTRIWYIHRSFSENSTTTVTKNKFRYRLKKYSVTARNSILPWQKQTKWSGSIQVRPMCSKRTWNYLICTVIVRYHKKTCKNQRI